MKRIGLVVILLLLVLAYVAGYWPYHKKVVEMQKASVWFDTRVWQLESSLRLYRLQSQLVTLVQETEKKNYANAAELSTKFFNTLSGAVPLAASPAPRASLQTILNQRDAVTAALAKGDPAALDLLKQMLATLTQSIPADGPPPMPKS
jgi:predicted negative regulator of RcsB-dependent stress response